MEDWRAAKGEYIHLRVSSLAKLGLFFREIDGSAGFYSDLWKDLGYSSSDAHRENWLDMVHPDDRERARKAAEDVMSGRSQMFREEYRFRDSTGRYRWLLSVGVVHDRDEQGRATTYLGLDQDVSEIYRLRETSHEAMRVAEERAMEAETLRTAGAIIVSSLDRTETITAVFEQMQGMVRADYGCVFEVYDRQLRYVGGTAPSDMECDSTRKSLEKKMMESVRRRAPDVVSDPENPDLGIWLLVPLVVRGNTVGVMGIHRSDGNAFEGDQVRFVMAIADYLALSLTNARLYEQMSYMASTDQLSLLLTRHAFFSSADAAFRRAQSRSGPIACILADIDFFKTVNDRFGHLVGDEVIRTIGTLFRQNLRTSDIVGRYGGEEFCAVLPNTDLDTAIAVAERLNAAAGEYQIENLPEPVTISVGVSAIMEDRWKTDGRQGIRPAPGRLEELLDEADRALYQAKRTGRDRVCIFDGPAEGPSAESP